MNNIQESISLCILCFSKTLSIIIKESDLFIFWNSICSMILHIPHIIDFNIDFHYLIVKFIEFECSIRNIMKAWAIFYHSNTGIANCCKSAVKLFVYVSLNKKRNVTRLWFVWMWVWFRYVINILFVIRYLTQHSSSCSIWIQSIIWT